jgi:hypothetical protein
VSGSFVAFANSTTLQALYDSETATSLAVDNSYSTDFLSIVLPRIKITGDAPDDGEKAIMRTYPFTAAINLSGSDVTAYDKTVISIQGSAA